MGLKNYKGSCHCGAVRYEVALDLSVGTGKCNCTFCAKSRFWGTHVKPEAFRLVSGENDLVTYHFNSGTIDHLFCKHCGIHSFGRGHLEQMGGRFCIVNVACLDDVPAADLAELPVRYSDGRNNNWGSAPTETRHL